MRKLMMTTALVAATSFGAMAQTGDQADAETPIHGIVPAFLTSDFTGMTLYTLDSDAVRDWRRERQGAVEPGDEAAADTQATHDGAIRTGESRMDRWTSSERFFAERDAWESVGSISDVVIGQDGEVRGVLIDVGGVLGFLARTVMVEFDELYFVAEDADPEGLSDVFVVVNMSRDQLEALPEWDDEVLRTGFAYQPRMGQPSMGQPRMGVHSAEPVRGDAADSLHDASATATATEAGRIGTPGGRAEVPEGYVVVDAGTPTVEQLLDADVHDAMGDNIGNVNDVILREGDGPQEVIVDVGGFLGIGSHTVSLPMNGAEVLWNSQEDSVRIHLPMTREQLETLPEYEG